MENFNWTQYAIILAGAVFGTVAILPYAFELNKDKLAQAPLSTPQLMILSVIQGAVLFAVLTFLGLNATSAIGLDILAPLEILPMAILTGVVATGLLVIIEVVMFQPHLPEALRDKSHRIALWKRFLASFYGGISEEVLTRLFLVSGIAWLIGQVTQAGTDTAIPLAIGLSAVLFGIGHLPATATMTQLTPLIIIRAIVLNGIIGIVCGWLFWQYGFLAAVVAHYSADIVLHVITPSLLNRHNQNQQVTSIQPTLSMGFLRFTPQRS